MRRLLGVIAVSCLFLSGCGNQAYSRARSIVFDVPYLKYEQTHESLIVGIKILSEVDAKVLFCKTGELLQKYHVLYMRVRNTGTKTYLVSLKDQPLLKEKEAVHFFDPHSAWGSALTTLAMIPLSFALATTATSSLMYFATLIGAPLGLHYLQELVLGSAGYDAMAKHLITRDGANTGSLMPIIPFSSEHYWLLVDKRDPNSMVIALDIAEKGQPTSRLTFDLTDYYQAR